MRHICSCVLLLCCCAVHYNISASLYDIRWFVGSFLTFLALHTLRADKIAHTHKHKHILRNTNVDRNERAKPTPTTATTINQTTLYYTTNAYERMHRAYVMSEQTKRATTITAAATASGISNSTNKNP